MALIKCPECGREISDKAVSCPGCGCPASEFPNSRTAQRDTRSGFEANEGMRYKMGGYRLVKDTATVETQEDLERIADEIFWKNPKLCISNVSKLQKKANIDADKAYALLEERVKELKRGTDKRICPRCGSDDIARTQDDGSSSTISISEGIYHTKYRKGKTRCECLNCGKKWSF